MESIDEEKCLREELDPENLEDGMTLSFNQAFKLAGSSGRYQYWLLAMLALSWFTTTTIVEVQTFLNQDPIFMCPDSNSTSGYTQCTIDGGACNVDGRILSADSPDSLVVYLGLYCDRAWIKSLANALFFAGGSLGCLIGVYFSDKYGRKITTIVTYAIGLVFVVVLGFAKHTWIYFIGLIFNWAGFDPFFAICTVIASEQGGKAIRQLSTTMLLVFCALSEIVFVGFAYYVRNWQDQILFGCAIPIALGLIPLFFVQESSRFYYGKLNLQEAIVQLKKIAKINKQRLANINFQLENPLTGMEETELNKTNIPKQDYNFTHLFKYKSLRGDTIKICIYMVYLFLTYAAFTFGVADLGGNIYLNAFLVCTGELLGYISTGFLMQYYQKKTIAKGSLILSIIFGFAFLLIPLFPNQKDILTALFSMIIKYLICLCYPMVYVYANEIFPTPIRSVGVGFSIFVGRFGSVLAPFVLLLAQSIGINQMIIYSLIGILTFFAVNQLPETKGDDLNDAIREEVEHYSFHESNSENNQQKNM